MKKFLLLLAISVGVSACQNRNTYDLPAHVPVAPSYSNSGVGNPNAAYKQGFRRGKQDGKRGYQDMIVPPGNPTFQKGYRDGFKMFHPGGF